MLMQKPRALVPPAERGRSTVERADAEGAGGATSDSVLTRNSYVALIVGFSTSGHVERFSCGNTLERLVPWPGVSTSGITRTPRARANCTTSRMSCGV